jgi:polyisoprenoid-binding protein YceI
MNLEPIAMHRCLAPLLFAALCASITSPAAAQQVDPMGSELVFVTTQMGVPVEGRFQRWAATLALDPRAPDGGRLDLRIQTDSVAFAAPEVTAEAQRPVWLDTARYPQAEFVSTGIRAAAGGQYQMRGRLTLKGRTHEVTVPLSLAQSGAQATAIGAFTLQRGDFRIGDGEFTDESLLAPEVQVRFRLAMSALPTP